jgi:putative transposase
MPHTYTQITTHVIFSTKNRTKSIPQNFQPKLWAYAAGICRNHKIVPLAIGGTDDHIHLLVQIPPTMDMSKAVTTIKANSSRWAHEEGQKFVWQQGYAAFSVSASSIQSVVRYIQNQEIHHKKMSFEEEWSALLKKHNIEFDARSSLS